MAPYALASLAVPQGMSLVSLSQNESLRPPSPHVAKAVERMSSHGAGYPDPDWSALRRAIAEAHSVPAHQILCGAGSLDLISALARVFAGPTASVLVPKHAYPFFCSVAQMVGAKCILAPETGTTVDVDALLHAVRPETAVVFVANPGNPTGTRLPKSELLRLRAGLPERTLLVIDEAYGEFADHLGEWCWDMVDRGGTVVLRSFSKAYALAGFRVGWGLFPPEIGADLRKVMNPNNLAAISQAAAIAAVEDQPYMRETCQLTATLRDTVLGRLRAAGFDVGPSLTNFLLIRFTDAQQAQAADAALLASGIVLRAQAGAGLPSCLRMTIGTETECRKAVDTLIHWKRTNTP